MWHECFGAYKDEENCSRSIEVAECLEKTASGKRAVSRAKKKMEPVKTPSGSIKNSKRGLK